MKFHFCGGLDCPDWLLAEMSLLAKLTSVRIKLLCVQVINELLGGSIDYAKVSKLTSVAKYDESDIKATVAAISFIVTSAAKYAVSKDVLMDELQQLGLPREHTLAISKAYSQKQSQLQHVLTDASLRGPQLKNLKWRLDYIVASNHLQDVDAPAVHFKMDVAPSRGAPAISHTFEVPDDKFALLLADLKHARAIMQGLI